MIKEFLNQYEYAVNLDDEKFHGYFREDRNNEKSNFLNRADFLLFDCQVVCEHKNIENLRISKQVEALAILASQDGGVSENKIRSKLHNQIKEKLSQANKQIRITKDKLDCRDALGLIILDNQINNLSVLTLIDATIRKMRFSGGLDSTDCVLCLDLVNAFSNSQGESFRPAQLILRNTDRSRKLSEMSHRLMKDFCDSSNIPFIPGLEIKKGEQLWSVDQHGNYHTYKAEADFSLPVIEVQLTLIQRLAQILSKWWWLIPAPFIVHDLFVR